MVNVIIERTHEEIIRDKREKEILVVCLNILKHLINYIICVKLGLSKKVRRVVKEKYIYDDLFST